MYINRMTEFYFKKCVVKCCTNDSYKTPEKYFVSVPSIRRLADRRRKWFDLLGLQMTLDKTFVCEDHFNLAEDSENYLYFKTIGSKLVLKKDILPHKNLLSNPKPTPPQITIPKEKPNHNVLVVNLQKFKEENLENLRQLEQARKELNLQVKKKRKRKKKIVKSKVEIEAPRSPEPSQPTFQTIAYLPTGLFNINAIPSGSSPTLGCNYLEPRTYVNLCGPQIVSPCIMANKNQETLEKQMNIKEDPDMDIDNHELYYPEVQIKEEIKEEPIEPANFEFVSMAPELENVFYNEDS